MSLTTTTENLRLEGNHIIKARCKVGPCGHFVDATFDLDSCLGNGNGNFEWDSGIFSHSIVESFPVTLSGTILKAKLEVNSGDPEEGISEVDLSNKIFNDNGVLKYIASGIPPAPPPTAPVSDAGVGITDPLLDGNIEASAFSVACDVDHDRCRIAYKTYIDDKISLAEVEFVNGDWKMATDIEVFQRAMVGSNFALTYDALSDDKRSLFFSEENGDGYIYCQSFISNRWEKPERLRGKKSSDDGYKAHRFSKLAGTHWLGANTLPFIFLYYVDENRSLCELIGKKLPANNRYIWSSGRRLAEHVPANGYFSVGQRGGQTHVLFRNESRELCLITGGERGSDGQAKWGDEIVLRGNKQLSKNSPLALATSNGKTMAIFYLQSEGRSKTIYSLNYMPGTEISKLSPIRIGKLEPDSVLGAASFKSGRFDSRLFSVSNLDGDNILLERVPKEVVLPAGSIQRKEKLAWVISGGVVETDVDHLVAQVTPQEEDSDSD